eukprot:gene16888-20081_t
MGGLKELNLANNLIEVIPVQVAELTLFVLEVHGNPIALPPPDVIELGIEGIMDYLMDESNSALIRSFSMMDLKSRHQSLPSRSFSINGPQLKSTMSSDDLSPKRQSMSPPSRLVSTGSKKNLFTPTGNSMVIQASPTAITNTYYTPSKKVKPKMQKRSKDTIEQIQSVLLGGTETSDSRRPNNAPASSPEPTAISPPTSPKWIGSQTLVLADSAARKEAKREQKEAKKIQEKEARRRKDEERRERKEDKRKQGRLETKPTVSPDPNPSTTESGQTTGFTSTSISQDFSTLESSAIDSSASSETSNSPMSCPQTTPIARSTSILHMDGSSILMEEVRSLPSLDDSSTSMPSGSASMPTSPVSPLSPTLSSASLSSTSSSSMGGLAQHSNGHQRQSSMLHKSHHVLQKMATVLNLTRPLVKTLALPQASTLTRSDTHYLSPPKQVSPPPTINNNNLKESESASDLALDGSPSRRERRGTIASECDLKLYSKSANSLTTIKPLPPLIDLLRDVHGNQCFRGFLVTEFSNENLDFWNRVEKFKSQDAASQATDYTKIFNQFISDRSSSQVNLPRSCVKRIEEAFANKDLNGVPCNINKLFEEAQGIIFKLMESDSFERFKRSSFSFKFQNGIY